MAWGGGGRARAWRQRGGVDVESEAVAAWGRCRSRSVCRLLAARRAVMGWSSGAGAGLADLEVSRVFLSARFYSSQGKYEIFGKFSFFCIICWALELVWNRRGTSLLELTCLGSEHCVASLNLWLRNVTVLSVFGISLL